MGNHQKILIFFCLNDLWSKYSLSVTQEENIFQEVNCFPPCSKTTYTERRRVNLSTDYTYHSKDARIFSRKFFPISWKFTALELYYTEEGEQAQAKVECSEYVLCYQLLHIAKAVEGEDWMKIFSLRSTRRPLKTRSLPEACVLQLLCLFNKEK